VIPREVAAEERGNRELLSRMRADGYTLVLAPAVRAPFPGSFAQCAVLRKAGAEKVLTMEGSRMTGLFDRTLTRI
jgi:hypothetical protein